MLNNNTDRFKGCDIMNITGIVAMSIAISLLITLSFGLGALIQDITKSDFNYGIFIMIIFGVFVNIRTAIKKPKLDILM